MTNRLLFFSMFSMLLISTSACIDDPEDVIPSNFNPSGQPGQTFSCVLNGSDFEPLNILVTGTSGENDSLQFLTAAGVVFNNTDTTVVTVSVFTSDAMGFQQGVTYSSTTNILEEHCLGVVSYNAGAVQHEAATDEEQGYSASCTITMLDLVEGTWSGEFSFTAHDDFVGVDYVAADGQFDQVPF